MEIKDSLLYRWAEERQRANAEEQRNIQELWERRLWNEEHFLVWAQRRYNYRAGSKHGYLTKTAAGAGEINWLYKYGRDYFVLTCTHAQFEAYILGQLYYRGPWYYTKSHWKRREYWYTAHGVDHRQRMGYRGGAEKKQLSEKEISRREWRERKGFRRDKAKGRGWYGGNRKNWAKASSNRGERRYVRQRLQQGKEVTLTHRWWADPWMWD